LPFIAISNEHSILPTDQFLREKEKKYNIKAIRKREYIYAHE
jgi:hypothetical protein